MMGEVRFVGRVFGVGIALLVGGCGGGKQWVAETPAPTRVEGGPELRTLSALEEDALWRDSTRAEPRPRLNRVMSLGEIDLPSSESPAGAETSDPSPVVVNVNNSISHSVYYGGGYGYGYGAPGYGYGVPHRWSSSHRHNKGHKGSKPQSTTPKVGGDWPKIEVP